MSPYRGRRVDRAGPAHPKVRMRSLLRAGMIAFKQLGCTVAFAHALTGCATNGTAVVENHSRSFGAVEFGRLLRSPSDLPQPQVRYVVHIDGMGLTARAPFRQSLVSAIQEQGYSLVATGAWTPAELPRPLRIDRSGLNCSAPWRDHLDPDAGNVDDPCLLAAHERPFDWREST